MKRNVLAFYFGNRFHFTNMWNTQTRNTYTQNPYVIHPFDRPEYINFLKPILFLARDSSSGFRQGYHKFLYGHKKYNRGSGRKRTNEQYRLKSAPSARGGWGLWHFFVQLFVHFVDYRGRIFFAKLLQKPLKYQLIFDCLPHCLLLLTVVDYLSASLFANWPSLASFANLTLSGFLCQLDPLWLPLPTGLFSPTSGLVWDLELRPLFGFAPKQRDRLPGVPPT